jgi:protein gp37
MSDNSRIEWTDATWNFVVGCTKVSPGCDNCYAERDVNRWNGDGAFDTVVLKPEKLELPLHWRRPRRIFVNSLSDLFHEAVPDELIAEAFAVMAATPRHTYQILTKRHARMRSLLSSGDFFVAVSDHAIEACGLSGVPWPLPNVWLGVSVEDQKWADIRIPALLDTPAAVRFLSCEPLLGSVDLRACGGVSAIDRDWIGGPGGGSGAPHPFVDWVIVGGESGPGARPMHPDWVRTIRDDCYQADVALFFKQWGQWRYAVECGDFAVEQAMRADGSYQKFERLPVHTMWPDGRIDRHAIPEPGVTASMMRVRSKHDAGRELDGITHDGMPDRPAVLT